MLPVTALPRKDLYLHTLLKLGENYLCRRIVILKQQITFCPPSQRFPTGQDSAIFWDKETEVPSLSEDKETTGQAQNLAN